MQTKNIIIGICVVIGLSLLFYGIHKNMKVDPSIQWPTITGKITESRMERTNMGTRSDADVHKSFFGGTSVIGDKHIKYEYRLYLTYKYEIGGTKYQNGIISENISMTSTNESDIIRMKNIYYEGKDVNIHYNPINPQQAYLEYHAPTVWGWIAGAIIIGVVTPLIIHFGQFNEYNGSLFGKPAYQQPSFVNVSL
jgi:hypothetical protein